MQIRAFNHHSLYPGHTGSNGGIHPCCELLYITEGKAVLEWMGEEYAVSAPCLFLLTPNTPHRLVPLQPVHFWYIELNVGEDDPFVSAEQAILWNRSQEKADYGIPGMTGIMHTLEALVGALELSYNDYGDYDEKIVLLDIQKIIRLILNRLRATKLNTFDTRYKTARELIHTLMRHMESFYFEPIDLTELSEKVHLNSSYLVRVFKSEIGVTPMQYLSNLRLSAAASYLIHTEISIQQIAELTGFNSIHYFSRIFKQKYGDSPQQWRAARCISKVPLDKTALRNTDIHHVNIVQRQGGKSPSQRDL